MFLAALMSRSCRVRQDGHCHVRVCRLARVGRGVRRRDLELRVSGPLREDLSGSVPEGLLQGDHTSARNARPGGPASARVGDAAARRRGMPGTYTPSSPLQDSCIDCETMGATPYAIPPRRERRGILARSLVSTPTSLVLPDSVRRTAIETSRGAFAALEAVPGSGVCERQPAVLVPGYTGSKEDFLAILAPAGRGRAPGAGARHARAVRDGRPGRSPGLHHR